MGKVVKGALIGGAVGGAVAGAQAARKRSSAQRSGTSDPMLEVSVRNRILRAAAEGALLGAGVGFVLDRRDARRLAVLRSRPALQRGASAVAEAALPVLQHAAEAARDAARPHVAAAAETVRSRA
ncbi:MAG: hypothetical protein M3R01_12350, partial [Actinomycetota bacterium]|nr:hypothetical protein [Actinomycetota bacterium]